MLRTRTWRDALLGTDHQRGARPAVRYIADIGRLINDLIECDEQEVAEHDFRDWPQTFHRGADRRAEDCSLGDRRVDHTIRTPAFLEAPAQPEHSAGLADIFAKQDDLRPRSHLVMECPIDRKRVV